MDGWMDGWMDRLIDGQMDGWRDEWMDGWIDEWMDRTILWTSYPKPQSQGLLTLLNTRNDGELCLAKPCQNKIRYEKFILT